MSGTLTGSGRRRPDVLSGFRDHLPAEMILRRRIMDTLGTIFERHGFEPIDTPALERLEVLTGKAGENEKLMYRFEDNGGRSVGLRYDLTVPLARFVAAHENDLPLPFKRYHLAPVWRAESPQRGRFREFWQCDVDIAGSASVAADAEVIAIASECLRAVGLSGAFVAMSHRKLLAAIARSAGVGDERAGTIYRSVDKLAKIGANGVWRELTVAGIDGDSARRVLDAVSMTGNKDDLLRELGQRLDGDAEGEEAIAQLQGLLALLPMLGVPEDAFRLDVSLARGLDYYTGVVFEAIVDEPKIGSVAGGGRYDGLVGLFLGRDVPATGVSLGVERIVEVVHEFDLLPLPPTVAQVMVAVFPDLVGTAAELASELRATGLNVDLSLLGHRRLGDQLKYASRRGIPIVVIAGAEVVERGEVTLKDLRTGEQSAVERSRLADVIRESIGVAEPSAAG